MATNWDDYSGDDDFGEIGAADFVGADGSQEIVGDSIAGPEDDLLRALSISGPQRTPQMAAMQKRYGRLWTAHQLLLRRVSAARTVDPGAVVVRDNPLNTRRRFPLGIVPTSVPALGAATIPAVPQDLFRTERLVIPSSIAFDFGLLDVKVGNTSQLVSGGEVPAALFSEVAIDTNVHFKTAAIGNQITLSVRNKTAGAIDFSAGMIGTTVM